MNLKEFIEWNDFGGFNLGVVPSYARDDVIRMSIEDKYEVTPAIKRWLNEEYDRLKEYGFFEVRTKNEKNDAFE